MERYCSTGQSTQRAVVPTEEEEEVAGWHHVNKRLSHLSNLLKCILYSEEHRIIRPFVTTEFLFVIWTICVK